MRKALRRLARRPGQSGLAVAAIALGVGLTAAMFAVVQGTFLRGLPFDAADRIVQVSRRPLSEGGVLVAELAAWQEAATGLDRVAGWVGTGSVWSGDGLPAERRNGAYACRGLFAVTGVEPAFGRSFLPQDALPGAPSVVVLSDALWRERYGGDRGVLGRSVELGGRPATVVGVMPPGFQFPLRQEFWLPLEPLLATIGERVRLPIQVVARLAPNGTAERAVAALGAVADRAAEAVGESAVETTVTPFVAAYTADARRPLGFAGAAVVGVLLIACANVANLLLARGLARSEELAVRAALGAGRRRIAGELLAEATALASAGGALGVAVAWAAVAAYRAGGGLVASFWVDVRLDLPSLGVAAAATGVTALLAGALPALRAARLEPGRVLEGRRGATGMRLGRVGRALVVAQVAFSCALLVGTTLMLESVRSLEAHDFGAEPEGVWTAAVTPATGAEEAAWPRFYRDLLERAEAVPGIERAALASHLPSGRTPTVAVEVEGRPAAAPGDAPAARLAVASPGYFEVLGRPVLRGRGFLPADRQGAEPVVVVSRSFARSFLAEDAVGRRLRIAAPGGPPGEWRRVVGVAPDLFLDRDYFEERIDAGSPPGVYVPLAQSPQPGLHLLARTSLPPDRLTPELRQVVQALAPGVPLLDPGTLSDAVAETTADHRRVRTLLAGFAAVALALAGLGLYGVLSFTVGERRRELGVRTALGARRGQLVALVTRGAAVQVVLGLLAGAALGGVVSRLLEGLLFAVTPWDPRAFAGTALALAAVAALAAAGPARRAARLDPAEVLRAE